MIYFAFDLYIDIRFMSQSNINTSIICVQSYSMNYCLSASPTPINALNITVNTELSPTICSLIFSHIFLPSLNATFFPSFLSLSISF